jgi:molybdopterin converting factor small subunit
MTAQIYFPTVLFDLTKTWSLEVDGATLREIIDNLAVQYPGIKKAICADSDSEIRRGLIVSINNKRAMSIDEPVPEGSKIDILQAVAGG